MQGCSESRRIIGEDPYHFQYRPTCTWQCGGCDWLGDYKKCSCVSSMKNNSRENPEFRGYKCIFRPICKQCFALKQDTVIKSRESRLAAKLGGRKCNKEQAPDPVVTTYEACDTCGRHWSRCRRRIWCCPNCRGCCEKYFSAGSAADRLQRWEGWLVN